MSAEEGHDPPQVPHWMHISRRETPAVAAETSSRNLRFGVVSVGGETISEAKGCVLKMHLLHGADLSYSLKDLFAE